MTKINKEDYRKMKLAMETKDFSLLENLNLADCVNKEAFRSVLEENAYAGISLEDTFGTIELIDNEPTGSISQDEIDALLNT